MLETLMQQDADWLSGEGPDSDVALYSQCELFRNLADYPYPGECTEDEQRAIEERVHGVLESLNFLSTGRYWSFNELDERERRFLVERRLVSAELLSGEGTHGVYIADDQSFSLSINDKNHLHLCGLASGLSLQDMWARVSLVDDTLAGALDYAFSDRLGFLTSSLGQVGTGLHASVILHLPGLHLAKRISAAVSSADEKRHTLEGVSAPKATMPGEFHRPNGSTLGDLYSLKNRSTLGRSEEETFFHLKHLAAELIKMEREARVEIISSAPLQIEDRVGRALGLARGARLLAFHEASSVLSSLRLGVSSGLVDQYSLHQINELLVASQNAHIEMKSGHACDEFTLNAERADLFRSHFA